MLGVPFICDKPYHEKTCFTLCILSPQANRRMCSLMHYQLLFSLLRWTGQLDYVNPLHTSDIC